ncbi:helix-turn-helix transcriptional regulator [Blautia sp. RD014234]|nr:helix-turn-helix transcriptional regulator [Blautia parvula]
MHQQTGNAGCQFQGQDTACHSVYKKHYNENLSINGLAELYNMSPNYFSSVFKKELNRSAVNYITEVRMEKARKYLKDTGLSVIEIAESVGYEDSQYFSGSLKRQPGSHPFSTGSNADPVNPCRNIYFKMVIYPFLLFPFWCILKNEKRKKGYLS